MDPFSLLATIIGSVVTAASGAAQASAGHGQPERRQRPRQEFVAPGGANALGSSSVMNSRGATDPGSRLTADSGDVRLRALSDLRSKLGV